MTDVGRQADVQAEIQNAASNVATLNELINTVARRGPWDQEEVMIEVRRADSHGEIEVIGEAGSARVIQK